MKNKSIYMIEPMNALEEKGNGDQPEEMTKERKLKRKKEENER